MVGNKPELLLPVGNVDSFYAALEGGADAIYLGLKQFNARGRARNITNRQLQAMVKIAGKKDIKTYVTLNTVIKNSEIEEIVQYLNFVLHCGIDAIIIQDWGVYYLVKKYFPNLAIHASTQMGNHNSLGTEFSDIRDFERVILARELTLPELKSICAKSKIQTEIFIHGALCYSFSGMCLFSSFLGGSGANRGLCAQPCRRSYSENENAKFLFNLKDNQQLKHISQFIEWGVSSLKVEGRMKSEEYVYRVAKAYRLVIDSNNLEEAAKLLEYDFGRQKTEYFYGENIKESIAKNTATGIQVGKVLQVEESILTFESNIELKQGSRVRIQTPGKDDRFTLKIKELEKNGNLYLIAYNKGTPKVNDSVFLTGIKEQRFKSKLEDIPLIRIPNLNFKFVQKVIKEFKFQETGKGKVQIFIRIGSLDWLRKIHLNEPDGVFLNFSKSEWKDFNADAPFIQKFGKKLFIELPRFISEKSISFYNDLLIKLGKKGIRNCVISHLSQKLMVPSGFKIISNENVYCFNDAAISQVLSEGINTIVFPYENDFENIVQGSYRNGIVPVYFYPELFYSRMPVKSTNEFIKND
ncbi:MAG: U32 family peptidase, partial [Mariniphaga sp.]|nr:U32 family peptidase [Mariniphaga sp.]